MTGLDIEGRSLHLGEEAYHAHPAWSYSRIARYARLGFAGLLTKEVRPTPEMLFGSLVDCMATRGVEEAARLHRVVDREPTPAKEAVVDALLAEAGAGVPWDGLSDGTKLRAMDAAGFQARWRDATRLEAIADLKDAYECRRAGAAPVSRADWDDALAIRDALYETGTPSGRLFGGMAMFQEQLLLPVDVELPCGETRTVQVKCMLDGISVHGGDRTLTPFDLKTMSRPAYEFPDQFVRMRYDTQASLYGELLAEAVASDPKWEGWTVLPFRFVAVDRESRRPLVFTYDQPGGLRFGRYRYKGWRRLLGEMVELEERGAEAPLGIDPEGENDLATLLGGGRAGESGGADEFGFDTEFD